MNATYFSKIFHSVIVLALIVTGAGCAPKTASDPEEQSVSAPFVGLESPPEEIAPAEKALSHEEETVTKEESEEKEETDDTPVKSGEMIPVPAGTFKMGRPYDWDPEWGAERVIELPVHDVYLDAYEIGKYEVTNQEYADVLNWAFKQGYLQDEKGEHYSDGLIYAYGQAIADTESSSNWSQITYNNGVFTTRSSIGYDNQQFPMANHPVVVVNWYGAVAYCNWLSEIQGLQPCYDTSNWTRYEPVRNGYRLPTEAEWERAASWDGEKHWRYSFTSDTLDTTRANYRYETGGFSNPLELRSVPRSSPVGWYNGVNPARLSEPDRLTKNSQSPIGAYDMSGNVWEWCHDWWYRPFTEEPVANPTGPESGSYRTLRGCAWFYPGDLCRAARNAPKPPDRRSYNYGMRIARTP